MITELILVLFIRLFDLRLFYLFPLPLGVWEGLQLVTVIFPELFSNLFCIRHIGLRLIFRPVQLVLFRSVRFCLLSRLFEQTCSLV